jgi:hypothetical protein
MMNNISAFPPVTCRQCGIILAMHGDDFEKKKELISNTCITCIYNPDGCFKFDYKEKK